MFNNEQGVVEVKQTLKRCNHVMNHDLPSDILSTEIWQKKFIPLIMAWAGVQMDPWTPDNGKLGDAIKLIGRTYVRPDFELTQFSTSKTYAEVSKVSNL